MCETPKSPPGDYNVFLRGGFEVGILECETPKSPPGDYNSASRSARPVAPGTACETPKSPPGDYNTASTCPPSPMRDHSSCETPKSPPGDYNEDVERDRRQHRRPRCETPKSPPGDYNPNVWATSITPSDAASVKHLNPRQGITTLYERASQST